MDKFLVTGPGILNGHVEVSCAKNAVLPIMAATILAPSDVRLKNVPKFQDVSFFQQILASLGMNVERVGEDIIFNPNTVNRFNADYDLVRKMRASFLVLGPLLARYGEVSVSLPGGCAIGSRPIDLHLMGLEALGAKIELSQGYVKATADKLKGTHINLPFPSVGATENIVMAAVLAEGETVIDNVAREPEIYDLCEFLIKLGYNISGHGGSTITVQGTPLNNLEKKEIAYKCIGDRIEAATFMIAALMTGADVNIEGFNPEHLKFVTDILENSGAKIESHDNGVKIEKSSGLTPFHIKTAPYPGFPTDVQAQMMALALTIDGASTIEENIFENRFMHVPELQRLGASIHLSGNRATVNGGVPLLSAPVMCTDLRASAALVLASLIAEGETEVGRVYHLDRGYQNLEKKLEKLGANIKRLK